jgi:hypothetical protein
LPVTEVEACSVIFKVFSRNRKCKSMRGKGLGALVPGSNLSAGSSQSPQSSRNKREPVTTIVRKQKRESAPTSNPDVASFQPKSDSAGGC